MHVCVCVQCEFQAPAPYLFITTMSYMYIPVHVHVHYTYIYHDDDVTLYKAQVAYSAYTPVHVYTSMEVHMYMALQTSQKPCNPQSTTVSTTVI